MREYQIPNCIVRDGDPVSIRGSVLTTPEGRSLARITNRDGVMLTIREFRWYERLYYRVGDFFLRQKEEQYERK